MYYQLVWMSVNKETIT